MKKITAHGTRQYSGLNYVRAISAVMVMFYHYTTQYMNIYLNISAEKNHIGLWWGCWAVATFFILSGFLTNLTLNNNTSAITFIKKRAIRLYPTYWVAIFLTTVVILLSNSSKFIGISATIMNFTMLQEFIGIPSVDGAYWTLRYELWFYVIIAIIIFIRKTDRISHISLIWIVFILLSYICTNMGFKIPHFAELVLNIVFMRQQAHLFIMGIAISEIIKNRKRLIAYINLVLGLVVNFMNHSWIHEIFIIIVCAIIFMSVITNFKLKYDMPLVLLAEISYPLYLIHQNIGYVIIREMSKWANAMIGAIFVAIMMIVVAWLIHKYFELPISKLLKRKLLHR